MTAIVRLYRLDVCFITFLTALAGPYFSTGSFGARDVGTALFIALVPYNYVYALNALTDRVEDAINHPERPLPSGSLSPQAAARYTLVLLLAAVGGATILFHGTALFLLLLVPLLGTLYSAPPFRLKDRPLVAAGLTAWGMVHPFFVTGEAAQAPLGLSFILLAAGVTIFKDLGDAAGDAAAGRRSIRGVLRLRHLYGLSSLLFLSGGFLLWIAERYIVLPLPAALVAMLAYRTLGVPLEKSAPLMYTHLIRAALAALCVTGVLAVVGMLEQAGV